MPEPLLLLKPEGSRDRAGVVTPTIGSGVTVVAGQYGQAWQCVSPASNPSGHLAVQVPKAGHIDASRGTMATRMRIPSGNTNTQYGISCGGAAPNRSYAGITLGHVPAFPFADQSGLQGVAGTALQWRTLIVTWDGSTVRTYIDGVLDDTAAYTGSAEGSSPIAVVMLGNSNVVTVESSLIFDRPLDVSEIAALSEPRAWSWDSLAPRAGNPLRLGMDMGL